MKTGWRAVVWTWLACEGAHFEDGQNDGDDHEADQPPQQEDHDGLHQGGDDLKARRDAVFTVVGHPEQHLPELAAPLARRHHLPGQRGEHEGIVHEFGEVPARLHAVDHVLDGFRHEQIVRHGLDDVQGLEQGHAVFEQHAEGARHVSDDERAVDAADAGQPQQQTMRGTPALRRLTHTPEGEQRKQDDEQEHPPSRTDAVAHGKQYLGGDGERAAHVGENLRDLGDHERQQEDDDADAHEQHEDGVGQRGLHLADQRDLLFDVLGEAFDYELQRARRLARAYHGHEGRGKDVGKFRQPVGEIAARHDPVAQAGDDALHARHVVVGADAAQRLIKRKARMQQGGELAGHGGDGGFGDRTERFEKAPFHRDH